MANQTQRRHGDELCTVNQITPGDIAMQSLGKNLFIHKRVYYGRFKIGGRWKQRALGEFPSVTAARDKLAEKSAETSAENGRENWILSAENRRDRSRVSSGRVSYRQIPQETAEQSF